MLGKSWTNAIVKYTILFRIKTRSDIRINGFLTDVTSAYIENQVYVW